MESRLHMVETVVVNVRSQLLVVVAAVIIPTQPVRLSPLPTMHPRHPTQLGHDGVLV